MFDKVPANTNQNRATKNRGLYPQRILSSHKEAQKRIEAYAEKRIKNYAIFILPKGSVYPKNLAISPLAFGAQFVFDEHGNEIGVSKGELPSYSSLTGKTYQIQIGGIYFGFVLTYYDPDYFKKIPNKRALADAGVVLEKEQKAYVLDIVSFIQIIMPELSKAEEAFNTFIVPYSKQGTFSGEVLYGVLREIETTILGAQRSIEGLNIFDEERVLDIATENERMLRLITKLISAADKILIAFASLLISYTIFEYLNDLPPKTKKKIKELLVKQGARTLGKKLAKILTKTLAKKIAKRIARTATYKKFANLLKVKAGSGARGATVVLSLLKAQGLLQRASNARHRLKKDNKMLYRYLAPHDLDMAYFLIEDHLLVIKDLVKKHLDNALTTEYPSIFKDVSPSKRRY